MIKFFRKIRKNLINEGKTARYFKYAIGEIVLVVFGILIALQINIWNEKQKTKAKIETLLDEIEVDVVENIKYANNKVAFFMRYMSMIERVRKKQVSAEDYRNNFDYSQLLFNYSNYRNNTKNMDKLLQLEDTIPLAYEPIIKQIRFLKDRKPYTELAWQDMIDAFRKNVDYYNTNGYDFIFSRDKASIEKSIAFYLSDKDYKNRIVKQALNFHNLLFEARINRVRLIAVLAEIKFIRDKYDKTQLIALFKGLGLNNYKSIGCDATTKSYANVQGSRQSPLIINISHMSFSMKATNKQDIMLYQKDIPVGITYIHDDWRGGIFNGGDYSKIMTFYKNEKCVAKMSEQDNGYIVLDGKD